MRYTDEKSKWGISYKLMLSHTRLFEQKLLITLELLSRWWFFIHCMFAPLFFRDILMTCSLHNVFDKWIGHPGRVFAARVGNYQGCPCFVSLTLKPIHRVATRSWSSWNVLEEKKMFLKFEITKNVLEMFLNFKKYHTFSKKCRIWNVF